MIKEKCVSQDKFKILKFCKNCSATGALRKHRPRVARYKEEGRSSFYHLRVAQRQFARCADW
ncbi:hypothetical protein A2U01_0078367 [Trifolium medium]|uniref:Uncharacterized protein n=1 Tax=Trifolium medium TaxID=97028 RepID=A0A392TAG2_9FABA|nr:hypothetical protein [Trifolium medium]